MTLNDLKAEFSHAYVRAVAHAAGFFAQEANRTFDGDGVDLTLLARSPEGTVRSPRLDLQLKATAAPVTEDPFAFDLPVKNYDELRSESLQVPRILVVVVVPEDAASWVSATEDSLLLRHCGYWMSLRGAAATENKATIRIQIQRSDCFHVPQVTSIMERIRQGGLP
jgi:hypothetical protein